ncbi:MAG: tRNA dihydrouridine synthase DusB [Bacteroidota bacterium]
MKIGSIDLGERPVFLAPMEDVTDMAFRLTCKEMGADVVVTEFVSSEAIIRDVKKTLNKLAVDERERPVAIQIYGQNVESMVNAAITASKANPDYIDINFGCPVRKVAGKGAGAGMLRTIPLMMEITSKVVKATHLPVTVKTRLGWDEKSIIINDIAEMLQDCGIAALTIHGRTRAQMYTGEADWEMIGKVKNNPRIKIPIIGNGDIDSAEKAKQMFDIYGVDGIMIGRAAVGNPWIFKQVKQFLNDGTLPEMPNLSERIDFCQKHLEGSMVQKGDIRALHEMRKHYSGYFRAVKNFKPFKIELMNAKTLDELKDIFGRIRESAEAE